MDTRVRLALTLVVWLGLAWCVSSIADDRLDQWDFQVYYTAGHAVAAGESPYRPIHPHPGLAGDLIFQYPPLTAYLFAWTSLLSLASAKLVWLGLKIIAVGLLGWIWTRDFERVDGTWPIALFVALGFNASLLRDFVTGNISTFEQLGIWIGFSLLVRNRPYAAAVALALVAQFKLLPIAFIALIPLIKPREGWKACLLGCGLYAGLLGLNAVLSPEQTHEYLRLFTQANVRMDDRGVNNPTSLAFFRDLLDLTAYIPGLPYNREAGTRVYVIYLVALLLVMIRALSRAKAGIHKVDSRLLVYLGCALYAIAMPRMKDYSYILMLIPALFVIRDIARRESTANYLLLGVGLMVLAQPQQTNVPGLQALIYMLQAYLPLAMAGVIVVYLLRPMSVPVTEPAPAHAVTAFKGQAPGM